MNCGNDHALTELLHTVIARYELKHSKGSRSVVQFENFVIRFKENAELKLRLFDWLIRHPKIKDRYYAYGKDTFRKQEKRFKTEYRKLFEKWWVVRKSKLLKEFPRPAEGVAALRAIRTSYPKALHFRGT